MAVWSRNQVTASKRRCTLMPVNSTDGTKAPRGTDFTGYVLIAKGQADYIQSLGTIVNKRRPLVIANDIIEAVDTGAESLQLTAHGLETGDGPVRFTNILGALPGGIAAGTDYWVIAVDADNIAIAVSVEDAYIDERVDLTDAGSGTNTLADTASTQRGIDGQFTYEATQAETDFEGAEAEVAILAHATYEAYSTVQMSEQGASAWDYPVENGWSALQIFRGMARTLLANFNDVGNTRTFRDLADTKDSHHGTITGSGRSATIDDLSE